MFTSFLIFYFFLNKSELNVDLDILNWKIGMVSFFWIFFSYTFSHSWNALYKHLLKSYV